MRFNSGLSLLETSVALVVLAGATLGSLALFHLGYQRQTQSSHRVLAVAVAERQLEELRLQASERPGFQRLRNLDGSYRPDATDSRFEVAMLAQEMTLHSPCSTLDEVGDPRVLESSAFQIATVVRWSRARPGIRLHTVLTEPRAPYERIRFAGDFSPLAREGERELTAALLDQDGQPIPGVKFQFWIRPRSAPATLNRMRDGRRARLIHRLENTPEEDSGTPAPSYSEGECIVTARARYFGQVIRQDSPPLDLSP